MDLCVEIAYWKFWLESSRVIEATHVAHSEQKLFILIKINFDNRPGWFVNEVNGVGWKKDQRDWDKNWLLDFSAKVKKLVETKHRQALSIIFLFFPVVNKKASWIVYLTQTRSVFKIRKT